MMTSKAKAKKTVKAASKPKAKAAAKPANMVTNVLLSGVGGQGTILASNILTEVFSGRRLRCEEERKCTAWRRGAVM